MALEKQPIIINFSQGLDQKTDPNQLPIGKFLRIQNSQFNKLKKLTKRNGFGQLTSLPSHASSLTTFNNNLVAIGDSIQAMVQGSNKWYNKGSFYPIDVDTLPLIRSSTNQIQADSVVSPNNLVCVAYTDTGSGSTLYKYAVLDSVTGQALISPTVIPNTGTVTNAPRVFLLNNYFIIVFGTVITATPHLQYIAINIVNPVAPTSAVDISSQFSPSTTLAFDGFVANNNLYLAWNGSDMGGAVRMIRIESTLMVGNTKTFVGSVGTMFSVYADITGSSPNIWVSFWDSGTTNGYALLVDSNLNTILSPTQIITTTAISNITSVASSGIMTFFYEIPNNYGYDSGIPTHLLRKNTITSTGTVGSSSIFVRSVGLASKAFLYNSVPYMLSVYFSNFQPTYFLINSTGQVIAKLAYSNAGGYKLTGLPGAVINGTIVDIAYQFKDLIETVNTTQGDTNPEPIYSQTGVNLVKYDFDSVSLFSEIGSVLNLTGGMPWMYDGFAPVELGFHVWPDNVEVTTATTGGFVTDQEYFYQALYKWTDNSGNIHRSAPSIPVNVTTTGGDTSTNTINIPTLRLTYKSANPVVIELYRWSTGQQEYHQVTSIQTPTFNNPAVDYITFTDTLADTSILGNSLIYTTGGVIEDIAAPSCSGMCLFDSRLWLIDAEDKNLLWYSKQVIENTPVEFSDLFTYYTAPSTSVQGSSGPTRCIFPMDDKLIIFKNDAMYFINGSGPDNTGLNNGYTPNPIYITGAVGCSNPQSIVLIPNGLMFQSDKGIWLLGRDLNTQFIGSPVEDYTSQGTVLSAVSIPGTTQVRFTLDSGVTLMYDYFEGGWGTFTIKALSSTIYNSLHTYVDSFSRVYQETPGKYFDGSVPVLQGFTTGWISISGLTGLQRIYWMNFLGTYISPHKLQVQIGYDYNPNPTQSTTIQTTNNYGGQWGNDVPVGDPGVWGGSQNWGAGQLIERKRLFLERQKCKSIQFIIDEVYDSSLGIQAGEGLSMSGITLTAGFKKSYPTVSAEDSYG